MKKYWLIAATLVLLLAVGAVTFVAGSRVGERERRDHPGAVNLQGRLVIELGAAIDKATRLVPGEVLKVEIESEDERYIYEVKVLARNGQVRKVKLDAQNGSLIEIEDD